VTTTYRVIHSSDLKPIPDTAYNFALKNSSDQLSPFELGAFYGLVVALNGGEALPVPTADLNMLTRLEAKGLIAVNWLERTICIQSKKGQGHA
jgi:hypothetical protein